MMMFQHLIFRPYKIQWGSTEALLAFMGGYASWLEVSYLTCHLTLYSPKSQQFEREWRPLANDNEANSHKSRWWVAKKIWKAV